MKTIETPRLSLRPFTPQDYEDFARINADPEVRRFMWDGTPTREQSRAELDRILAVDAEDGWDYLALAQKADGALIGQCGLFIDQSGGHAVLAYLLDKGYWGQGYGTEAMIAMLQYAIDRLPIETISATTPTEHWASRRVMEKLGMAYARSGRRKHLDVVTYEMSRQDFLAKHPIA